MPNQEPIPEEHKGYQCKVVAHSLNPATDTQLITFMVKYPLIVHAEFCRHRAFSRSVASNRAIPTGRIIQMVEEDPFTPERFPAERPGMQNTEWLQDGELLVAELDWKVARENAVWAAKQLLKDGVHKQIANRALGPYQWVTETITATDTDNFYGLRYHPAAQGEIAKIATMMWNAQSVSDPQVLQPGAWHLPFIGAIDRSCLSLDQQCIVSAARAARGSFLTSFQDKREFSYTEEMERYQRLMGGKPKHVSPTEHQAMAMDSDLVLMPKFSRDGLGNLEAEWVEQERYYGNLQGFLPFRHTHQDHVIKDVRLFWRSSGTGPEHP